VFGSVSDLGPRDLPWRVHIAAPSAVLLAIMQEHRLMATGAFLTLRVESNK
jgi:hypothetical protein